MDEEVISRTATLNPPSKELVGLLNRALNTLDPQRSPQWALDLVDDHDSEDEIEIRITRKVKKDIPG